MRKQPKQVSWLPARELAQVENGQKFSLSLDQKESLRLRLMPLKKLAVLGLGPVLWTGNCSSYALSKGPLCLGIE